VSQGGTHSHEAGRLFQSDSRTEVRTDRRRTLFHQDMPTRTKFPEWAAERFQKVGPQILDADGHLTPEEVVELILEQENETLASAEDVYQEWHDHGRVWEHPDGTVRITKPEQLDRE
jgi:hypothetical protein